MDNDLFLQHLRELSLEDGRAYIQAHAAELVDHAAVGDLIADEALRQLYTLFVSLKLAELLIFFGDYVHHVPSHALGLKAKGDALVQIGHYQAAMECLDAAGEEFLSLGDERNWARSRISWMTACAWLGHVEEALQQAARAREVFLRLGESYWVCIVDHNTAVIYKQVGRYYDAFDLYERMLTIYPTLTDQSETFIKRAIAIAEMSQAINLAWLGKFEQAYYLLQQAQAGFIALGETNLIIKSEVNLADLDYTQGYYGSALRRYYQARDSLMRNSIDDPILQVRLNLWMANCLVKLYRVQEACQLAVEAVEVSRQLGVSLDTGDALREYATMLVASGRSKEALAALDEAWALFNRGGFDHNASSTKLQQAELLLQIGSVHEAYDQAKAIKEYFDAQGLVSRSVRVSLVIVEALIEIAQLTEVQSREVQLTLLREAELLCEQVTGLAHQHNLQEQVYKSQHLLGRLATTQGDLEKAVEHHDVAIAQIEYMLDDLVYDLSPSFLHTTWVVYEGMIALCIQQGQAERAFSYLERARSIALRQYLNKSRVSVSEREEQEDAIPTSVLLAKNAAILRTQHELQEWRQKYHKYSVLIADIDVSTSSVVDPEVIQNELKRCETKISELFERLHLDQSDTHTISRSAQSQNGRLKTRNTRYVDVTQLRQRLSHDSLLLAYYLHKGKLVIFAATTEGLITYENPDGMEQLEHLLLFLHARLQPRGWPNLQQPPQEAVRRLLKKLYDLLIAPVASLLPPSSGYLTIVPYGPLHKLPFHALYDGSHFLIEDFQINYLPASSILTHLSTQRSEQNVRPLEGEVSTKPPLVFGYSGNRHLQQALAEAKAVAAMLDGRCYLEGDATIAHLIEQAPGSPIIHVATHGENRLDAPNFSFVRLADGQFNAIDAFSLDLKECELVALSGCETGLALSGGGDEQLGLGRAFLAAGTDSLLMSLWSVEDDSTNELMQIFYEHLLKGDSKVQALRAAQCHLIHQTSSIHTHPYFWAGFRLVGDTGFLKHRRVFLETETQALKR